jgi:hypothetical protein
MKMFLEAAIMIRSLLSDNKILIKSKVFQVQAIASLLYKEKAIDSTAYFMGSLSIRSLQIKKCPSMNDIY